MRTKIFNFPQEVILRLGLNIKEVLFLNYIEQFISSGNMRNKRVDGKWYFKLTYKKIMEDLPILKIKERQIRNMITRLEKIGILERLSNLKKEMYLQVDFDALYGDTLPTKLNLAEIGFHNEGNGLLTIDYYDIKKIKIIHNNARVRDLDKTNFYNNILAKLRLYLGEILYKGFIENKLTIDEITETYILFGVTNIKVLAIDNGTKFKVAFDDVISELLSQKGQGRSNL